MATKRKVTGKQLVDFASSFFSDLRLPDMMYGVLVRSPLPRGKIRSISHPQLPEGYFLYTAKDIPKNCSEVEGIDLDDESPSLSALFRTKSIAPGSWSMKPESPKSLYEQQIFIGM